MAGFKFTLDIAGSRSANHIATRPVKSTSGESKTYTQTSFAADMKNLRSPCKAFDLVGIFFAFSRIQC